VLMIDSRGSARRFGGEQARRRRAPSPPPASRAAAGWDVQGLEVLGQRREKNRWSGPTRVKRLGVRGGLIVSCRRSRRWTLRAPVGVEGWDSRIASTDCLCRWVVPVPYPIHRGQARRRRNRASLVALGPSSASAEAPGFTGSRRRPAVRVAGREQVPTEICARSRARRVEGRRRAGDPTTTRRWP